MVTIDRYGAAPIDSQIGGDELTSIGAEPVIARAAAFGAPRVDGVNRIITDWLRARGRSEPALGAPVCVPLRSRGAKRGASIGHRFQPVRQTVVMAVAGDSTRAPRRDVAALFAAYLAGDSLAVIGKREGVSGERIRQLFRAAGYPTLATSHTNRQRSQERRAELEAPVVDAYRRLESITEVAKQLGISVGLATSVLAEAGIETGRRRSQPTTLLRPKVTATFCTDVLSEAARREGGTISEKRYQAMLRAGASTDGQAWPWPSTILARLGAKTWNEAVVIAGVPECAPGAGSRGVGDDDLTSLAVELEGTLGRLPAPGEFGKAAKAAGLPGLQSVERRFGSWDSFVATVRAALDSGASGFETTSASDQNRP